MIMTGSDGNCFAAPATGHVPLYAANGPANIR